MMIRFFLILSFLTLLMSSCVITEDITFANNGAVKYQLAIDMSQLSQAGGSGNMQGLPTEPVSIAELIKDSILNFDKLSAEHKQILLDLAPFTMKAKSEDEDEEYTVKIYGDFENIDQLNKALIALDKSRELEALIKGESAEQNPMAKFSPIGKLSTFLWNGKKMQRIYAESNLPKEEPEVETEENDLDDSLVGNMAKQMVEPMMQMLEMGQFITRYHFTKSIKKSNIELGDISEDGKTLTITQVGLNFIEPEFRETIIDIK